MPSILILTILLGAGHRGPSAIRLESQPNRYQHSRHDLAVPVQQLINGKAEYHASTDQPSNKPENSSESVIAWSSVIQAICAAVVAGLTVFLVLYTKGLWTSNHDMVNAAVQSANAASASATAAERSAEAAVMSVAAEQRAWVGFEIEIATPLILDSVYAKPPNKVWHFEFRYVLTHSGKTPALNVRFHLRAEPWITMATKPDEAPVRGTDIEKLRHAVTHALRDDTNDFRARTIFPSSPPQDGRKGAVIDDDRVIAAREAGYHWTGQFIVVAAVTYRTVTGEWHFSDKVLHLGRKNGKDIDLDGPTIPKDEIGLHETGSHYGRAT